MLYNSYVPHSNTITDAIPKEETATSAPIPSSIPSLQQPQQQQSLSIPSALHSNKKMITVKASHKNVTRRFFLGYLDPQTCHPIQQGKVLPGIDLYQMLLEKIYTLFQFKQNYSITIQYVDDEHDIIPIHSIDELTCAMHCQQKAAIRKQQELQNEDPSSFIPYAQIEQHSREQILRINIVHSKKKIYSKKRTADSTPISNNKPDKELKHRSRIDNGPKVTTPNGIAAC